MFDAIAHDSREQVSLIFKVVVGCPLAHLCALKDAIDGCALKAICRELLCRHIQNTFAFFLCQLVEARKWHGYIAPFAIQTCGLDFTIRPTSLIVKWR